MKSYVALKPICLKGRRYRIGENVPTEAVIESQAPKLKRMGYLADSDERKEEIVAAPKIIPPLKIILPVKENGEVKGTISLELGEMQDVFEIVQMDVKGAAEAVALLSTADALQAVCICDSRKGVREAAGKRITQLMEGEDRWNGTEDE